jgi:hypothetical protein
MPRTGRQNARRSGRHSLDYSRGPAQRPADAIRHAVHRQGTRRLAGPPPASRVVTPDSGTLSPLRPLLHKRHTSHRRSLARRPVPGVVVAALTATASAAQLTNRARLDGEGERFNLKGRTLRPASGIAAVQPLPRGSSREYRPFWRQCMPVRQPEARKLIVGDAFGSPSATLQEMENGGRDQRVCKPLI